MVAFNVWLYDRGWMVNIPLYFVEEWVVWEGK